MLKKLYFVFLLTLVSQISISQDFDYLPKTSNKLILKHIAFTISFIKEYKQAEWVAYKLSAQMLNGTARRSNRFVVDPVLPLDCASPEVYRGSGYDRGHLCPAADLKWDLKAMDESFYMTNICPQTPGFNRGIWLNLEETVRIWARKLGTIYVVTGPILSDTLMAFERIKDIPIPKYFYKIILEKDTATRAIGFLFKNQTNSSTIFNSVVTVDSIEVLTSLDMFSNLPKEIEKYVEAHVDISFWKNLSSMPQNNYLNWKNEDKDDTTTKFQSVGTKPLSSQTQVLKEEINDHMIVFVTKSGTKYHRINCRYLMSSKQPINLEEARKKYQPCKVCNPPN